MGYFTPLKGEFKMASFRRKMKKKKSKKLFKRTSRLHKKNRRGQVRRGGYQL